jgi:ABC-type lipopolysaccharide export system ATPase subunit
MENYIDRKMTGEFLLLLQEYPIVTILGPRQAGKTTFARKMPFPITSMSTSSYLRIGTWLAMTLKHFWLA